MPAVSVCDSLAVTIRQNLDTAGQSKSSDDLSIGLAGSASRILRTELDYEETDNYRSTVQDRLKSKCTVLSIPKQENSESGKAKDGAAGSKNMEKSKEPRLPEPTVTLYPADKVNLGWNKNFPIGAGMYNVGNTCYLNSTLQALFHVPALVNWLLSDPHHDTKCEQTDGAGECLTCAVAKTLQISHQKSGDAIKPYYVYDKLKLICRTMVPGQQEDAHEFLRYLLEGMEKAYLARHKALKLDSYSKETTPINQIFGGYIRTEVKCLQCRHVSTTFQHFQDLLLDIRKAGTLDEALAGYFSQEHLDNNDYKCEACKRRVPATKQFILERPPKVLCVQLKRFSVLGGKISRHIGFKQTVDMGPYMRRQPDEPAPKLTYRLASMVTHMGPSVNCGHYTAIAQVASGKFYIFDDSWVRATSLSNVVSTNAYIMIFEMEPSSSSSSSGQSHSGQMVSSKTDSMTKGSTLSFSHSNGLSSKLLDNNGSKNMMTTNKKDDSASSSSKPRDREQVASSSPQVPPPPTISSNARRNFIGPVLPPHIEKNRQYEVLKSNKLVDYDGDSSEEENCTLKIVREGRENGSSSKSVKINGYSYSPQTSPSVQNGNGHYSWSNSNTANGVSSSSNSSNGSSSRGSSPKNGSSNGKHNGEQNGYSNGKTKDSRYYSKMWVDSSQKIYTKATHNKGWQVREDTSSPSSHDVPNGWLVSDNLNESNGNSRSSDSHSMPPNAAEIRNFNGTNRSDTVSHLQKSSQWAYGNSNVHSWNGNKTRLDRDVDNQRRQDRKRSFDNEEDDLDRGRVKKMKMYDNYNKVRNDSKHNQFQEHQKIRNDSKHNQFQEHQKVRNDSKHNQFQDHQKWQYNNQYRPNNNVNYRPRHGGNHNRRYNNQHHYNKSRTHWRR